MASVVNSNEAIEAPFCLINVLLRIVLQVKRTIGFAELCPLLFFGSLDGFFGRDFNL